MTAGRSEHGSGLGGVDRAILCGPPEAKTAAEVALDAGFPRRSLLTRYLRQLMAAEEMFLNPCMGWYRPLMPR